MAGASDNYERAQRVLPGGVNSPVRAMRQIGREPIFIERPTTTPIHGATAVYGTYSDTGHTSMTILFTSRGGGERWVEVVKQ